jgi:hypothetical protein
MADGNKTAKRPPPLRLTRSELELLEIEMSSAIANGAESPAYASIRRKVRAALAGVDLPRGSQP